MRPLFDALYDTMDPERLNAYMERGTIEVAPLAFMRGRTLNDWFIILDEAQNTSPEQMQMFLTRLGFGSKMVVTGDITQIDLPREQASGLIQVRDILREVDGIGFVRVRRTRTSSGTSSCSGSSRRTSATPRRPGRPARSDRGRGREPLAASRSTRPARVELARRVLAAEGVDAGELGLAFVGAGRDPRAEAGASRDRRGDRRARVPDRRARRAARRACRGSSVTSSSARRSSATSGAGRSCTRSCTCSGYEHGDAMERGRRSRVSISSPPERRVSRRPPAPGRAPTLLESFNVAFEGIIHVLRTQRNMRIHFLIAVAVIAAAAAFDVGQIELIVLLLAIAFVLVTRDGQLGDRGRDRHLVDVVRPEGEAREGHRRGRSADLDRHCGRGRLSRVRARGGARTLERSSTGVATRPRRSRSSRSCSSIVIVIATKALSGRGTPLRGGLPSGHAAVAFAGWMAATLRDRRRAPLPRSRR